MNEYITRERALEILNDIGGCGAEPESYTAGWDEAINAAYEAIQSEPAADVAPVVHGRWIRFKEPDSETGYIHMRCSVCTAYWSDPSHADHFRYCPSCGAKMDENEVENLKRCSCGDRYYCPEVEKGENGKWFIRCHMCHRIVWGDTIEEAADKWNRRADTDDP